MIIRYTIFGVFCTLMCALTACKTATHASEKVYNVRDFGALADGVHDDSPAIAEAVAAARKSPGSIVFLPAGRYRLETRQESSCGTGIPRVFA